VPQPPGGRRLLAGSEQATTPAFSNVSHDFWRARRSAARTMKGTMSRSGSSAPIQTESARGVVRFVVRGYGRAVAMIAATAFAGGLVEALFLVTITRAGFAIANGGDEIGIVRDWALSVESTLFVAVVLVALRMALAAHATRQSANVSTRAVARIRHRLSDAFLNSSWEVQQAQSSGSLQELLTTNSNQAASLMTNLTQGVVAVANLVALLGMAFAVDAAGALVLIVSVTVLSVLLRPLRSIVRRRARDSTAAGMELAVAVNEISELGFELHVFHVQDRAKARLGEAIERGQQALANLQFAAGVSTPVYTTLAYLAIVGALAVVAASNTTSLTSFGATMLVMLRSLTYGQATQSAYVSVSGNVPAIEQLQRRLHLFDAGRRLDDGQPVGRVGAITMKDVSFAYPQGKAVLRDISFTIAPHEIIGIVGPSGAGKSTLVQLLLGLRTPDEGRVLAGGRDIATFDRAEWARKVTFVPQSAHLITGTIADNIRFLRDDVTQDDVERAARLAHLHEDIERFADGYQHQVGKQGGHLSGGQQQRLCIARALVEHPDVLILDEPTSALDVRSEHLIRNTLLSLKERMTVIVIAHRLSTLTICDRIMVIRDGELKDFDTPCALEQSSDFYREALALSGLR
jgi:ATP-binding cassette, subfamily B, bacterial